MLAKQLEYLGGAASAGVVVDARVPIVRRVAPMEGCETAFVRVGRATRARVVVDRS